MSELDEFRQEYKTLSERAEERKAAAQARWQDERSRPLADAPEGAPEPRYNLWRCTDGQQTAFVRCPSRSGAKIFLYEHHGWGNKNIAAEQVHVVPEGQEILTATFKTVLEAAALNDGYKRKT